MCPCQYGREREPFHEQLRLAGLLPKSLRDGQINVQIWVGKRGEGNTKGAMSVVPPYLSPTLFCGFVPASGRLGLSPSYCPMGFQCPRQEWGVKEAHLQVFTDQSKGWKFPVRPAVHGPPVLHPPGHGQTVGPAYLHTTFFPQTTRCFCVQAHTCHRKTSLEWDRRPLPAAHTLGEWQQ